MRLRCCRSVSFLGFLCLTGCATTHRAETILHADGSIERTITQFSDKDPQPVDLAGNPLPLVEKVEKQPGPWQERIWSVEVRDGEKRQVISERGRFKAVKDIPDYYEFLALDTVPSSKLKRDYVRTDYVFVVEHRWRETLTEAVQLGDMLRAREELAELAIALAGHALSQEFGADYDFTALNQWMRTEGKPWFFELNDFAFGHSLSHKGLAARVALIDGLANICARQGLELRRNGKIPKLDQWDVNCVKPFLAAKLCPLVRSKATGMPLDVATAMAWLTPTKDGSPLRLALDKDIARQPSGKEAVHERLRVSFIRVFGLYYTFFRLEQNFDYAMTMPGEIVETNGLILAKDRVRWRFSGFDAYPLGYDMTCRSLELPKAVNAAGTPLEKREVQIDVVALLAEEDSADLLAVLRDCRDKGDFTPLMTRYWEFSMDNSKQAEANRII